MTDAAGARPDEKTRSSICDFVFSKARVPQDFATLLPKLCGENKRIVATILAYPVRIAGETLLSLGVGSVSSHLRYRVHGAIRALRGAVNSLTQSGFALPLSLYGAQADCM